MPGAFPQVAQELWVVFHFSVREGSSLNARSQLIDLRLSLVNLLLYVLAFLFIMLLLVLSISSYLRYL